MMAMFFPESNVTTNVIVFLKSDECETFRNSLLFNPQERCKSLPDRRSRTSYRYSDKKFWDEWNEIAEGPGYFADIIPLEWSMNIRPTIAKRLSRLLHPALGALIMVIANKLQCTEQESSPEPTARTIRKSSREWPWQRQNLIAQTNWTFSSATRINTKTFQIYSHPPLPDQINGQRCCLTLKRLQASIRARASLSFGSGRHRTFTLSWSDCRTGRATASSTASAVPGTGSLCPRTCLAASSAYITP